jgi:lipopolysaccharide/colanic/teichoic acid biosynthesis glycosyltransferase
MSNKINALKAKSHIFFLADLVILIAAFLACIWFKAGNYTIYLPKYIEEFILFVAIWITCSFFFRKYSLHNMNGNFDIFKTILLSNLFAFTIVASIMYISRIAYFSRTIVLGTIALASVTELILGSVYFAFIHANISIDTNGRKNKKYKNGLALLNGTLTKLKLRKKEKQNYVYKAREEALLLEISKEAFDFIFSYARIDSPDTLILSSTSRFNIDTQIQPQFESIVNIQRINDIRFLNKFFESANAKLPVGGLFIDFVETKGLRKQRILSKYPPIFNYFFYTLDYIIKRIFPKFWLTKGLYFILTRGQNRVLTKAETYGRLYSCGFAMADEKFIDNYLYFIARKVSEPQFPKEPSYGPIVKLKRIGKGGKMVKIYKLRTMHPFAEYIQEYVYNTNGLQDGGKFKKDFRVSTMGRFLRSLWLDELPSLLNWIKGDLKLFGVRPLSKHYYSLYTKELQERRIKYKPGLIPPFYVDNPKTLKEIMESEIKYLDAYDKHPFITDFRNFFIAIFNIIFRRYRSK